MSEFGTTSPATQPAGWYYAEGDPPGTHRYWDGFQWTGGPQPVQVGMPGAGPAQHLVKAAGIGPRILAWLIDLVIAVLPLGILALVGGGSDDVLVVGYIALLLIFLGNQIVLQGLTGQTVGKKVLGLIVVNEVTGEPLGLLKAVGRFLIPTALNFACGLYWLIDYAWPLFDSRNQRLTDKMLKLTVAPVDRKESFL